MLAHLKRQREAFLDRHADADDFLVRNFSAATLGLWRAAEAPTRRCAIGDVLDAGAGRQAWSGVILASAKSYAAIDATPRGKRPPTWIGDVTDMPQVPSDAFDAVVCHQVLEHVRAPRAAMGEFLRVLRPGGRLVASAPHLSRRHELPQDYFRFTPEGLTMLAMDAGFSVEQTTTYGGFLSLLHHQASTLALGLFSAIPGAGAAATAANGLVSWAILMLDRILDPAGLMPLGVVIVARKPAGNDIQATVCGDVVRSKTFSSGLVRSKSVPGALDRESATANRVKR